MKVSKANRSPTEKKSRTSKLIVFIGLSFVDLEDELQKCFFNKENCFDKKRQFTQNYFKTLSSQTIGKNRIQSVLLHLLYKLLFVFRHSGEILARGAEVYGGKKF